MCVGGGGGYPSGRCGAGVNARLSSMSTIELTEDELHLVLSAVKSYLDDFGHEEADVLRRLKALLEKLQAAAAAAA